MLYYRTARAGAAAVVLLSVLTARATRADDFSASGTFVADNQAARFAFTVSDPAAPVTLRTFGYGGGTNSNGASINAGGFDPVLSLFGSDFQVIGYHDDGTAGTVPSDPSTGIAADAAWQLSLPSGSYFVALSQYDNFAAGPSMSDGFLYSDPNFTSQYGTSGSRFLDSSGNQRNGAWAFDITGAVNAAAVPEPGTVTVLLAGMALYGVSLIRCRK